MGKKSFLSSPTVANCQTEKLSKSNHIGALRRTEKEQVMEQNLYLGAPIGVRRFGYTHFGIYAGNCNGHDVVIHYNGDKKSKANATVRWDTLNDFADGDSIFIAHEMEEKATNTPEQRLRLAESRVGEKKYSLFLNNCEHFVNWCLSRKQESTQVKFAFSTLCVVGLIYIVSKG